MYVRMLKFILTHNQGKCAVLPVTPNYRVQVQVVITEEPLLWTIGTQLDVLYTAKPLYRGHHWDPAGCLVYNGTSL